MASVIEAAQRKAALEQQSKTEGNRQLLEGLKSIGQVGQSLVDKRMKVAQALALGKQFGMDENVARGMEPEQILKVQAINKGSIDAEFLKSAMNALAGRGTPNPPQGAQPASGTSQMQPASNSAMLTSDTTSTPITSPQVPIQAPPPKQQMVNPATARIAMQVAAANQPSDVLQYTPGKGLEKVGTKTKGDQVITSQMNPGLTASWETATPQQQALAKAMYEGRVRPSDLSFRERGVTTTLANEYANINGLEPFKAYNADVNATMAKFATSGKLGQNALSLNTALGHASSAFDSYQAIQNTNQAWLNKPINWLKKNTNDPNVVALGINLNALQGELANVFKNSGATDQEISHWREYLNGELTPAQYVGALGKIDELLKSRLSAMEYQQSTAGGGAGQLISPHAKEISDKLSNPTLNSNTPGWDQGSEQRLQMLLDKKSKGTLKS